MNLIVQQLCRQLEEQSSLLVLIRNNRQGGIVTLRFDEKGVLGKPRIVAEGLPRPRLDATENSRT